MAWVIPRPFHDILSPFVPSTDGLIRFQIEITQEELNLWLTQLISASLIHNKADYIFPLWNAHPPTSNTPLVEDTYRDTWADFDPEPVENVGTGLITARGMELNEGDTITFTTHRHVISIPMRGINGGNVRIKVDGQLALNEVIGKDETVEFVIDTEKDNTQIEIEVV